MTALRALLPPSPADASDRATRAFDRCLEDVVDQLGGGERTASASIAELMRLRAVQDVAPSRAVEPFVLLKRALRAELGGPGADSASPEALSALEACADALALEAFDAYVAARERLFEVRMSELRRSDRVALALTERGRERAGSGEGEDPR